MRFTLSSFAVVAALGLALGTADAMPIGAASSNGSQLPVAQVALGCGPGLVRGRLGTCLRRPSVFSRSGRLLRKGCGKPINGTLRTPCR